MEERREHGPWPTPDWESASPESQGMDAAILEDLHTVIQEQALPIHALLIVRHGRLIFERYYHGQTAHDTQALFSCTKSVTSALVGIALCQDSLHILDRTLLDLLPDEQLFALDEQKRSLTLRHLLTMVGGLDNLTSGRYRFEEYTSFVEAVFSTPLLSPPGQSFCYGDPSVEVLAYVLERITHSDLLSFASEHLLHPLGIATDIQSGLRWERKPDGRYHGATGLHLRPRDMAKFGYLYLREGYWAGEQLIPRAYVQASTQAQNQGGWPEECAYGFLWWITTFGAYTAFYALGAGGQYIFVVPAVDLVVVISSEGVRQSREAQKSLLTRFVLPAIVENRERRPYAF